MIETMADDAVLVIEGEFSEQAEIESGGVTVVTVGLFDEKIEVVTEDGGRVTAPDSRFTAVKSHIGTAKKGDLFRIRGREYTIYDLREDGLGAAFLYVRRK